MRVFLGVLAGAMLMSGAAMAGGVPAAPGAYAYIILPPDGAVLRSPVTVVFGLVGMGVAPAGTHKRNTGHHHLLIDTDLPKRGQSIPFDARHKHFPGGETQVTLELKPGPHTLQLLLADFIHRPHSPPVKSPRITITVTP